MEEKLCENCGNYTFYYTRRYMRLAKTEHGFCMKCKIPAPCGLWKPKAPEPEIKECVDRADYYICRLENLILVIKELKENKTQ